MARKNNISIGNCGEYFVAAELERRGFSVAVPMSNTPAFDLLAIQRSNLSNQVAIQVKTNSGSGDNWSMSEKNENIIGNNIFYVLVRLSALGSPDFFVVPSKYVAEYVKTNHQKWLDTPGKKGQKHNDNPMRKFRFPDGDEERFKDAWDLMEK